MRNGIEVVNAIHLESGRTSLTAEEAAEVETISDELTAARALLMLEQRILDVLTRARLEPVETVDQAQPSTWATAPFIPARNVVTTWPSVWKIMLRWARTGSAGT